MCEAVLPSFNGAAFEVGDGFMVDVLCCTVVTLRITGLAIGRTPKQVFDTQSCGVTYCEGTDMTQRERLPQGKVNVDFRGFSQNKYNIASLRLVQRGVSTTDTEADLQCV